MIIPGYSSYDVDEHGVVTNLRTGKVVKSHLCNGYHVVTLTHDENRRCAESVHTLMAAAFKLPSGYRWVVTFKDGNRGNLELSNLECISRNELSRRHYNHSQNKRKNNCDTPESRQCVIDALSALDEPTTMTDLAMYLGVPYSVVRYSTHHLIDDGIVKKVKGGYVLTCQEYSC